jgi:hypothetical protein
MLSVIGERNVDVLFGEITGFTSRGFSKGPNIQSADCASAARAGSDIFVVVAITNARRAAYGDMCSNMQPATPTPSDRAGNTYSPIMGIQAPPVASRQASAF